MVLSNIEFKNFSQRKKNFKIKKILNELLNDFQKKNSQVLLSLSNKYKYNIELKKINKYRKFKYFKIFGMGGSCLGAQAIYFFLKKKN